MFSGPIANIAEIKVSIGQHVHNVPRNTSVCCRTCCILVSTCSRKWWTAYWICLAEVLWYLTGVFIVAFYVVFCPRTIKNWIIAYFCAVFGPRTVKNRIIMSDYVSRNRKYHVKTFNKSTWCSMRDYSVNKTYYLTVLIHKIKNKAPQTGVSKNA